MVQSLRETDYESRRADEYLSDMGKWTGVYFSPSSSHGTEEGSIHSAQEDRLQS